MQRISIALEPGMGAQINQLKPGQNLLTASNQLICQQLARLHNWRPLDIHRRWGFVPPPGRGGSKPKPPVKALDDTDKPTPGTTPGASLDEINKGLRQNCPIINAALTGIPATDAMIRKNADEVFKIMIPAANSRRDEIAPALAATAGVPLDDFIKACNHAIHFNSLVKRAKFRDAQARVAGTHDYLRHIGLLVSTNVIPSRIPWRRPCMDSVAGTLYVPFDDAAHRQLNQLKVDTGLGKEELCHELLISALAGTLTQRHLQRQLEASLMLEKRDQLAKLNGTILYYHSRLKARLAPPEKDPALAPFISELKAKLNELQSQSRIVRRILVGAILARRDDDEFVKLVQRVNEARRLFQNHRDTKPVDDETCRQINALLVRLGF